MGKYNRLFFLFVSFSNTDLYRNKIIKLSDMVLNVHRKILITNINNLKLLKWFKTIINKRE